MLKAGTSINRLFRCQRRFVHRISSERLASTPTAVTFPVNVCTLRAALDQKQARSSQSIVLFLSEDCVDGILENKGQNDDFVKANALAGNTFSKSCFIDFKGKTSTSTVIYPAEATTNGCSRLVLVGTGKKDKLDVDGVRSAVHHAVAACQDLKLTDLSFFLPKHVVSTPRAFSAIGGTSVLSSHAFDKYVAEDKRKAPLSSLQLVYDHEEEALGQLGAHDHANAHEEECQRGATAAEGTLLARELANDRADVVNPAYVEEIARSLASTHDNLTCTTVDVAGLHQLDLRLLASVGQGSAVPPRLVTLEYKGNPDNDDCIALVGKGVTFDTGGLNIKPTGAIENMHMDMGGSAAVLGCMKSLARLQLKVNVVACLALAENAVSNTAYFPHQIIQTRQGSVEVSNTDAEGRLCLADALLYVQDTHNPIEIVDVATLTGACVVALGEYTAGLFSNDEALAARLLAAGEITKEPCWRLPILPEHTAEIELKGAMADIKSTGTGREGGACTAAAFLKKFILDDTTKWAHVDIAGPAMYSAPREWMPKGGTGFGAQLLLEYSAQHQPKTNN